MSVYSKKFEEIIVAGINEIQLTTPIERHAVKYSLEFMCSGKSEIQRAKNVIEMYKFTVTYLLMEYLFRSGERGTYLFLPQGF